MKPCELTCNQRQRKGCQWKGLSIVGMSLIIIEGAIVLAFDGTEQLGHVATTKGVNLWATIKF